MKSPVSLESGRVGTRAAVLWLRVELMPMQMLVCHHTIVPHPRLCELMMFVCKSLYTRAVPNIRFEFEPDRIVGQMDYIVFVFDRILPRFGTRILIVDNCPRGHAMPRACEETQQLMLARVMKRCLSS